MKKETFIYTVESPIYDTDKRGNVTIIPVGTVLSQREYDALKSDNARSKCKKTLKVNAPRVRFTNEELSKAISLYLDYTKGDGAVVGEAEAIAEMQLLNPQRTGASINMLFCQIRALDVYVSQEGLKSQSKALVKKLYNIDPNRFPAGEKFEAESEAKLDSLLAQVRG